MHYLLTLKLFQTCTSFFLADTKEDILKNVGNHAATFFHTMEVNGCWQLLLEQLESHNFYFWFNHLLKKCFIVSVSFHVFSNKNITHRVSLLQNPVKRVLCSGC